MADGGVSQMRKKVDGVEEVMNIAAADIEETPDFGTQLSSGYILGMAKVKGVVRAILNIDRIVAGDLPATT